MNQELEFARTLETVRKTAKEQGNVISQEQVKEAFKGLGLGDGQLELVLDYLRKHKIGIGEPVNPDDYLTEEDVRYLDWYLAEIAAHPVLSEGEKEAVMLSAMAGEQAAKARLIELFLPQAAELARLYACQGVLLEDLIGEGNVALTAGVEMLGCLEKKEEIQGMLGKMMMDAMEGLIADTLRESETDKQVLERVNEVNEKAKELSESLLRKITVEELSAETGIAAEEIRGAVRISASAIAYIEPEADD